MSEDAVKQGGRWSVFFFYLYRFNAVLFLLFLAGFGWMMVSSYAEYRNYEDHNVSEEGGFARGNEGIEGGIIDTENGERVSYTIQPIDKQGRDIAGTNLSFTAMENGTTRLVLPDGGKQIVLNWEELEATGRGAKAYSVIAGSEQDFKAGLMDWIVGRFSDLEQSTLARRVSYVDAPQLIDSETMSAIVWLTPEVAEFWIVDLTTFSVVLKRPVALPARDASEAGYSAPANSALEAAESVENL